ncbi:CBM6 domain-containing protein OS=Streptomyces microflavus OX=1919 GN=Smic_70590 PE=4 SV=1 [Streptomyces microflavus]
MLATLDETTYTGGNMKGDHPLRLPAPDLPGRPLLLHRPRPHQGVLRRAAFRQHVSGGLRYATGQVKANCRPDKDYRPIFNGKTLEGWSSAVPGEVLRQ